MFNKSVISQVEHAFKDTPSPGRNIGRDYYEGEELWKPLLNMHWTKLSLDLIKKYRDELPMMSREGFRFYLPAFMLAILTHPKEVDTLHTSLILALTPPSHRNLQSTASVETIMSMMEGFRKRAITFSQQEIAAVLAFLKFYKQEYVEDFIGGDFELINGALNFWETLLHDE